jgi:SEC-C motif-containing protein
MLCPCNSGKNYDHCCQPLHEGSFPESALSLMRSRYSAYALHQPEYIIHTTHPDNPHYKKNHSQWVQEILHFCQNTQFQKLEILEVIEGVDESYVTFNAHLLQNHQKINLIEKSHFVKEGKQWLYKDAVYLK